MKRSRLRRRNPVRAAARLAECFGPQAALCRSSPCSVPGCRAGPPCDPAHHPSRGAGGLDADTFPLCRAHHAEQHQIGVASFARRYRIVLEELVLATRRRLPAVPSFPRSKPSYRVPRGDLPF